MGGDLLADPCILKLNDGKQQRLLAERRRLPDSWVTSRAQVSDNLSTQTHRTEHLLTFNAGFIKSKEILISFQVDYNF